MNEIIEVTASEAETEQVITVDLPLEAARRSRMAKFWKAIFRARAHWRKIAKLSKRNPKGIGQCLPLLITLMLGFAAADYMVLFSFHEAFPLSPPDKSVNLSIRELFTFPKAAADDFFIITTVTTTFILSIGISTIAACLAFWKIALGPFLLILFLFTMTGFTLSYFAMLSKFIPHIVTIAEVNVKVEATYIVIFYDIYVIMLLCAFAFTIQCWWSSRRKQDANVGASLV